MKFSVLRVQFVDNEPGMSLGSKSDCSQASQTCCNIPLLFGKDFPRLSFLFSLRGCGWGEGLEEGK